MYFMQHQSSFYARDYVTNGYYWTEIVVTICDS